MKSRIIAILLSAVLAPWSLAVDPLPESEDAVARVAPEKGQIEVLMAPVALYPDALVALILPAATHPSEIVLASRFLQSGGKDEDIEAQPWDDSVKALAHYPEVIQFMDENLAWTQDVGDAFVAYPADVMTVIQTLRARAARNGLLADTTQQKVIFDEDDTIRIVPAEPDVIYVPYYEPSYLYYTDTYVYYPSSLVWFGVGYGIGSWLSYDCNWSHRTIWVTNYRYWDHGYNWRRRYDSNFKWHVGGSDWTCWRPSTHHRYSRPRGDFNYSRASINYTRWNHAGDRDRDGGRDWNRNRDNTRDWGRNRDNDRNNNNGAWTRHPRTTSSTNTPGTDRSLSRPDSLRNPSNVDRDGDRNGGRDWNRNRDNNRNDNNGAWTRHPRTTSSTTAAPNTDRSLSRPDTLRNPSNADRDGRRDWSSRRDRDSSVSFDRSNKTPVVESTTGTTTQPTTRTRGPDANRRNQAPIHRNPDLVTQRNGSLDRRNESPRSTSTPPPTVRREQPRQTVSAPPPRSSPPPSRTITSGADIRHPRSSPSPQPSRVQSAPPAVTRSESARSAPPSPNSGSIRHGRADSREN